MLHVLRHYLPLRKALLVGSETVLLTLVVHHGMSLHLRGSLTPQVLTSLALQGLDRGDAINRCLVSAVLISALAQVAIGFNELYDFRVSSSRYDRAARFLVSAGSAVLLAIAAVVFVRLAGLQHLLHFPGTPTTQRVLLLTISLIVGFAALLVWRNVFHWLLHRLKLNDRVLVLGSGRAARALVAEILGRPDAGHEVVGLVSPDGSWQARGEPEGSAPALRFVPRTARTGSAAAQVAPETGGAAVRLPQQRAQDEPVPLYFEAPAAERASAPEPLQVSLLELVRDLDADSVAVALEDRRGVQPTDDLLRCRLEGVIVEEGEALFERVTGKIAVEAMRPSYLIFNKGFVLGAAAELAKRTLDIALGIVGLVLATPLMVVTAIIVRLDSPGPVLFRQERCGRHGRPFTLLKFRSMRADAEKASGPVWATTDDPRITRVGKFLRKSRVDELPQLVNVLFGDMSMVGPRPERPHFVAELAEKIPYFEQRHIVKPGLTGWAQINYPYGNTLEDAVQKLQYDLFYIKYQSVLFDLSILFNTIKIVVLRRGT